MNPFHCSNCNKLLGMIDGKAEIKCPRCKRMNFFADKWKIEDEEGNIHEINQPLSLNYIVGSIQE